MDTLAKTRTETPGGNQRSRDTAPRSHLFVVLHCDRPLLSSSRHALDDVAEVTIGRGRAGARRDIDGADGTARRLRLELPDPWMSSTHARLVREGGRWVLEDAGSKNGTLRNGILERRAALQDGDLIELGHTLLSFREMLPTRVDDPLDLDAGGMALLSYGMGTLLPALAHDFQRLAEVARSPVSVVIRGESGAGKEVVARAVHTLSGRAGAFVAANCGAIPQNLVESELFGHKKGAFSGAIDDRLGLVRSADGGTLLLDEIGDLPPASQAAFLRVLQEREVLAVGGTRPARVDLRVVSATHRDLGDLVARDRFRADLYARIDGFTLRLPPLRRRKEDFGLLVAALLRRLRPDDAERVSFEVEAARALFRYEWPLNVRELEKCLEVAVVLSAGAPIGVAHLPEAIRPPTAEDDAAARPLTEEEERQRAAIVALLVEHGGNIAAVARAVGKARMQVQRWIKRYRIDADSYRSKDG